MTVLLLTRSFYLMRTLSILFALLVLLTGCQSSDSTNGNQYPTRPITYLVPWNPGGGTDTISRTLAAVLQEELGVSINVVNRSGGGGVVGHLALSSARPDGYTLGAITGEITMMHWQGLTPLRHTDFTPLALLSYNPGAITVRADAPWNNLDELLAEIRSNPGDLLASGTSKGGIWDLARIGFLDAAGLPESALPWVPSQGAAPALQELLANGVQVVTAALAETDALLKAGEVKVLAVMADNRLEAYPDIPTLKEQGIDWAIGGWVTIGAPANLPPEITKTLSDAILKVTQDSAYTTPLKKAGFNLITTSGNELTSFFQKEDETNGKLLEMAGVAQ